MPTDAPGATMTGFTDRRLRLGTDIVAVGRIQALLTSGGTRFLDKWFSPAEIEYCQAKAHPAQHFAARVAAKEAVVKSLRMTWDGPPDWRHIEILPGDDGAPDTRLGGRPLQAARELGIHGFTVSLSHCAEYATSVAVAEATQTQGDSA